MGRRTQAERDAITVEIGYALVSAFFVAAATFGGMVCPVFLFDVPRTAERLLTASAAMAATIAFLVRVFHVLWHFRGSRPQPSQPGRTSPDS